MKISTTIKKKYFEMKLEDLKRDDHFFEYKEEKEFWSKRISKISVDDTGKPLERTEIVFLVGKNPYWFEIEQIVYTTVIPEKYADAVKTEYVYAIKCINKTSEIRNESLFNF